MSALSDLATIIAKISPLIASVIPLPGAEFIAQIVAEAFGGNITNTKALGNLIEGDPDAKVKLATIESSMKVQLEQIASTNLQNNLLAEKARLDASIQQNESDRLDRQNARELAKISPMPAHISWIVVSGFFILIVVILFIPLDKKPENMNIIFMLYGTAASAFTNVITYWLGSTSSSKTKDDLIGSTVTSNNNAANTAQEVKTSLGVANTSINRKIDNLGRVGDQVHHLVNSNMGVQLKMNYVLADRVAQLTRDPADIKAAQIAHKLYQDHEDSQAESDADNTKQST